MKLFLGIKVADINREEMVDRIISLAKTPGKNTAFYINAHCANIAHRDPEYLRILNQASIVYAGGQGIVWAAKLLNLPIKQRINIIDFLEPLVFRLKENNLSLYLLGGESGYIQKASSALESMGLKILGARSGFFDAKEESQIIEEINVLRPNILMVGMGVPKQEKWIDQHLQALNVNLCWGVGGFFKIASGLIKRTPRWISSSGLEWVYLSICEPKRFFARYLISHPQFILRVIVGKIKKTDF